MFVSSPVLLYDATFGYLYMNHKSRGSGKISGTWKGVVVRGEREW